MLDRLFFVFVGATKALKSLVSNDILVMEMMTWTEVVATMHLLCSRLLLILPIVCREEGLVWTSYN